MVRIDQYHHTPLKRGRQAPSPIRRSLRRIRRTKSFRSLHALLPGFWATVDGFEKEIHLAQEAGLDGFALNAGA